MIPVSTLAAIMNKGIRYWSACKYYKVFLKTYFSQKFQNHPVREGKIGYTFWLLANINKSVFSFKKLHRVMRVHCTVERI